MEVDTGAAVSLISDATFKSLWPEASRPPLQPSSVLLRTYTGEQLTLVGQVSVNVSYGGKCHRLPLLIVRGNGPSLLGRDWVSVLALKLEELSVLHTRNGDGLQGILERHADVFRDELGLDRGLKVKLHMKDSAKPRFYKARPCPILKRGGSIRLCGDYKLTINRAAIVDPYPLPRIEDILSSIGNAKVFSKLDLANAYLQLALDEESKAYVTVSTHRGLFRYNRLPFGVSSAPAVFQRTMETLLGDIPKVSVYIDDLLVSGESEEEHLKTLGRVLTRLQEAGLKLKRSKCSFMVSTVEYLGHVISEKGKREEKTKAIVNAPTPQNVTQLKSFLGLLNYYGKFLPHLASMLAPLYTLLKKGPPWHWGKEQNQAFRTAKEHLISAKVLTHFDPGKKLLLACDASPYRVAAVLSHQMEDGSDRPIVFVSRTLTPAEKKYSQLEKEGLAVEALDSSSPVTSAAIKSWTDKDSVLSRVRGFVLHGNWEPVEQDVNFKPFKNRELELSVQDGCILWGNRVVVPKPGRKKWPGIDGDLESQVKSCQACQVNRKSPPVTPLHPWKFPPRPWARLHIDFAGPFMGKQFIVLVDAHSKWLEVLVVSSCSSQQAIKFLRHVFSTHRLPEVLVSDNGSAFVSEEFQMFVKRSGIRHITSAPYHPASNGLAERGVQSFKEALKKSSGDAETRLASFLFAYRLIPHSTTGVSPAELLLGRRPRSLLDSLHPDLASKVSKCQERQKAAHDKHAKARSFVTGDRVYIRSFGWSPDWIPGLVTGVTKLALLVKLGNGKVVRRHVDHVRARSDADANDQQEEGEGREPLAVEHQSEEATVVGGGAPRAPDTSVENTEAGGDDGVTSAEASDSRESGLGRDMPPPPDGTDHSLSAQVQVDMAQRTKVSSQKHSGHQRHPSERLGF
ncbi:hypothetical protein EMCRGX_G000851 [Ephydatia muelleri]